MKLTHLVLSHVFIVVSANYLTQFPLDMGLFHTTWGAFTFPLIFLFTDLTVRLLGAHTARRVIFLVSIPVIFISWFVSSLFFTGHWQGVSGLTTFNGFVARIAVASFAAYAFGQLMDIFIFNKLRQSFSWWVAPAASMTFGNLVDSLLFFSIAFYASSDPFMAENWLSIALFDTVFKASVSLAFLLPTYGKIVKSLTKKADA